MKYYLRIQLLPFFNLQPDFLFPTRIRATGSMKNLLFFILFSAPVFAYSQNSSIDSLTSIIKMNEASSEYDSLILNSIKLSKLRFANTGDSLALIELREKENLMDRVTESAQGQYYYTLGFLNLKLYERFRIPSYINQALSSFNTALPALAEEEHELLPTTLSNMSLCYMIKEQNKEAIPYSERALELLKATNDTLAVIRTLVNLAGAYSNIGDYESSINTYRESVKRLQEIDNPEQTAIAFLNIGSNLQALSQYQETEDNFELGLEYAERTENYSLIAYCLTSLAALHFIEDTEVSDLKRGKSELDRAMKIQKEIGDSYYYAISETALANYYLQTKNYPQALAASRRYLNYFKKQGENSSLSDALIQMGRIYQASENLDSAAFYLKSGLQVAQKAGNDDLRRNALTDLTEIEVAQGNYQAAYGYKDQLNNLRDSLFTKNLDKAVAEQRVELQLDLEQEAREKAELRASLLSSRNNLIAAIAAGLAGILLIGGYLFFQLRKTRNQLAEQNQQLKDLNATKDKFFGIIAHDVRSPITALDGVSEQMHYYLEKEDKGKLTRLAGRIDGTVKRLTSLLDNLLNWALLQTGMIPYNPKSVSLNTIAEENLDLFRPIAEAKNISLSNEITRDLTVHADANALQTIIRNLLNNAIKFTPQGGEVSIQTEEKNDKVFIKINDTGTGISAEKLEKLFTLNKKSTAGTAGEKGSGLGLMLCRELVELNKGTIRAVSEVGKGSSFIFSLARG